MKGKREGSQAAESPTQHNHGVDEMDAAAITMSVRQCPPPKGAGTVRSPRSTQCATPVIRITQQLRPHLTPGQPLRPRLRLRSPARSPLLPRILLLLPSRLLLLLLPRLLLPATGEADRDLCSRLLLLLARLSAATSLPLASAASRLSALLLRSLQGLRDLLRPRLGLRCLLGLRDLLLCLLGLRDLLRDLLRCLLGLRDLLRDLLRRLLGLRDLPRCSLGLRDLLPSGLGLRDRERLPRDLERAFFSSNLVPLQQQKQRVQVSELLFQCRITVLGGHKYKQHRAVSDWQVDILQPA